MLINSQFPIIFESVKGECEQADGSLYNLVEIKAVLCYIKKLKNFKKIAMKDIGIVSPYRSQCDKLINFCKAAEYEEITIGTAEMFQVDERPVMIISAVRTDGILGFVKVDSVRQTEVISLNIKIISYTISFSSLQRLNVMITRPKCLLIIIGDDDTLSLDKNWNILIEYCRNNGALIKNNKVVHSRIEGPICN